MSKNEKPRLLKYFEVTIAEVGTWTWKHYIVFLIEALWQTVFPFVAGMLLVRRNELIWIFMLIIPIYFKLTIQKKDTLPKKKKIFVK